MKRIKPRPMPCAFCGEVVRSGTIRCDDRNACRRRADMLRAGTAKIVVVDAMKGDR